MNKSFVNKAATKSLILGHKKITHTKMFDK